MKVLSVEGTWVVRTKREIDPQVTYSGCRSLAIRFHALKSSDCSPFKMMYGQIDRQSDNCQRRV